MIDMDGEIEPEKFAEAPEVVSDESEALKQAERKWIVDLFRSKPEGTLVTRAEIAAAMSRPFVQPPPEEGDKRDEVVKLRERLDWEKVNRLVSSHVNGARALLERDFGVIVETVYGSGYKVLNDQEKLVFARTTRLARARRAAFKVRRALVAVDVTKLSRDEQVQRTAALAMTGVASAALSAKAVAKTALAISNGEATFELATRKLLAKFEVRKPKDEK